MVPNVSISDATLTTPQPTDLIPIARVGSTAALSVTARSLLSSPSYGAFYDTTNQTAASTTSAYTINLASTYISDGVTLSSGNRLSFSTAGVYNVQYSIQFVNPNASIQDVDVWFRLNGLDVSNSNSKWSVHEKHGSVNGAIIASINFFVEIAAGDYIQLMWSVSNTELYIATLPAQVNPIVPVTPGIILTANQIST